MYDVKMHKQILHELEVVGSQLAEARLALEQGKELTVEGMGQVADMIRVFTELKASVMLISLDLCAIVELVVPAEELATCAK